MKKVTYKFRLNKKKCNGLVLKCGIRVNLVKNSALLTEEQIILDYAAIKTGSILPANEEAAKLLESKEFLDRVQSQVKDKLSKAVSVSSMTEEYETKISDLKKTIEEKDVLVVEKSKENAELKKQLATLEKKIVKLEEENKKLKAAG